MRMLQGARGYSGVIMSQGCQITQVTGHQEKQGLQGVRGASKYLEVTEF